MLEIVKSGLYTSLQDKGRFHVSHLGVPVSGFMDSISANDANRMLSNDLKSSVLECTVMGPELLFHKPTAIAIAGAVIQPFINGEPSFINKVLKIHAGDSLTFGKIVKGARFYIAVRGGFLGDEIMNSQSTCITSSILSLLTKRDRITYADYDGYFEQPPLFLRNVGKKTIELQKGPEYQMLEDTTPNLKQLFQALFTVMPESNRMAYRVRHDVDLKHKISIISSATMPGTVQLTPGGDLIFLMKDAQTTGGYPRVFQLTEQGICDLAQMKPGEKCRVVERAF